MLDIKATARFLVLRVFNMTRSCILLRKFKDSDIWSLPISQIDLDADPVLILPDIVKRNLSGSYEFMAALNILEYTSVMEGKGNYHTIVYDVKYKGKVIPALPLSLQGKFAESKWVPAEAIKTRNDLNFATDSYVAALEKESCL